MKVYILGNREDCNISVVSKLQSYGIKCELIDIDSFLREKKFSSIKIVRFFQKQKQLKLLFQNYSINKQEDIVQIHFVTPIYLICYPYLKKKFKKIILWFWGSDLYRQKKFFIKIMYPLFCSADKICFATDTMADSFFQIFPKLKYKDYRLRLGLQILDIIDEITEKDLDSFRYRLNIPKEKKIVVVGYNAKPEQQHIKVIDSLTNSVSSDVFFIFPWGYGITSIEYEESLLKSINLKKLDYIFIKDFLNIKDIACLRCITDVFIHVQTTDALSGSMQESLYAGCNVITGSWLPYKIFDDLNIKMIKVDSPGEVGNVIEYVLSTPLDSIERENNRNAIGKLSKWDECIKDWLVLYN